MRESFYFYDLETTGFDARQARIMQFAGQRTDMDLEPIGEPDNFLVKLTPDILPSPDAILVTGITPQKTLMEGVTEAEFIKNFCEKIVEPNTIFAGYNSVRFDDEFMRYTLYRNFYDAYAWEWKNNSSRWDLLDTVRMTRALRPEGIEWPFTPEGKPTNSLEPFTSANNLEHGNAHDALSDVYATIAVAKLIKDKQPELFDYLLNFRHKKAVKELVGKNEPFIYVTGKYSSDYLHTSAAILLAPNANQDAAFVYDLRFDPRPFMKMSASELADVWRYKKDKDPEAIKLPVKILKYNRCPAVAPMGVVKDPKVQERLKLNLETIAQHKAYLNKNRQEFANKILEAAKLLDQEREEAQAGVVNNELNVDGRLYEGFIGPTDAIVMAAVRDREPDELSNLIDRFKDDRLKSLLPLYKARNFPKTLSQDERAAWDEYRQKKLFQGDAQSSASKFFARLQELAAQETDSQRQYLLEELRLYGESILPDDVTG